VFDALMMTAALALPAKDTASPAVSFLNCVIAHESGGNPRAENPTSTASGLFQFIDGTWRHYASKVPSARKYYHAAHAPAKVQWEVALLAVKWNGHGHWRGTNCGYGT
jgi:resuscitation-promoting factor RpfA